MTETNNSWKKTANTELIAMLELTNVRWERGGSTEYTTHNHYVITAPVFDTYFDREIVVKDGMVMHGDVVYGEELDEYGDQVVLEDNRRVIPMEFNWQTIQPEQLAAAMRDSLRKFSVNVPMQTKGKGYDFNNPRGPWFKPGRVYELSDADAQRFGVLDCSVRRIDPNLPSVNDGDNVVEDVYGVIIVTQDAFQLALDGLAEDIQYKEETSRETKNKGNYLESIALLDSAPPAYRMRLIDGRKLFMPCLPGDSEDTPSTVNVPANVRRMPMGRRRTS